MAIAQDVAPGRSSRRVKICRQEFCVDIRSGSGRGTPLVMFSGLGAGMDLFQPLVDAIDPAIEIIRVDTPGVGRSPAALRPYPFAELAWMMSRLLDRLGYRQVDVLGYSWGGALAQQFALQHAARCRRLVLLSTSTGALSVPGDVRALVGLIAPPDSHIPGLTRGPETLFRTTGQQRRADMRLLLKALQGDGTGRGYLHQLAALATWTSLPFLPLVSQPVLVMSGKDDPIVPPSNARLMAKLLPHATLEMFPGGHMEVISSADKLGWSVSRFLAPVSPV